MTQNQKLKMFWKQVVWHFSYYFLFSISLPFPFILPLSSIPWKNTPESIFSTLFLIREKSGYSLLTGFHFLDTNTNLRIFEGHLNAGSWPKACERLDVNLCGQWPPALAVHRKCQRLQVLNVENLFILHCLQHVLARHNLYNSYKQ